MPFRGLATTRLPASHETRDRRVSRVQLDVGAFEVDAHSLSYQARTALQPSADNAKPGCQRTDVGQCALQPAASSVAGAHRRSALMKVSKEV